MVWFFENGGEIGGIDDGWWFLTRNIKGAVCFFGSSWLLVWGFFLIGLVSAF